MKKSEILIKFPNNMRAGVNALMKAIENGFEPEEIEEVEEVKKKTTKKPTKKKEKTEEIEEKPEEK